MKPRASRCLKFRIKEVKGLNYPCSVNKGADQLRGNREAGLPLVFAYMQEAGFLMTWLNYKVVFTKWHQAFARNHGHFHRTKYDKGLFSIDLQRDYNVGNAI